MAKKEEDNEQDKENANEAGYGQQEGLVLKQAKGGSCVTDMNDAEKPSLKDNLSCGVRPYPELAELVSGCHQRGNKEKEHIPPLTPGRLCSSHSLPYSQRRGLPGAALLDGRGR